MFISMGISEYAVKYAVMNMSVKPGTFTCQNMADEIGCDEKTVYRALQRLIDSGLVLRSGCKRHGFRYEVISQHAHN